MSTIHFTPEQQEMLRSNQYTDRVTAAMLFLSKEFKELFYQEWQEGVLPQEIFRKHGYPVEVLGKKRIRGISHNIRQEYDKKKSFSNANSPSSESVNDSNNSRDEEIRQLQQKLAYVTQEIEFLKKIVSIRNIRK